jgi:MraZ protein
VVNCGIKRFIFGLNSHQATTTLINFIGTYECKIDAKGRFMMPVALKKQLDPVLQEGFVLKRSVFQPCLELYPIQEWNKLMLKISGLNRFVKKNDDFIRRFTAGVKTIEIDTNGRLLIPRDLIGIASIKKELTVSSGIGIIEIWDRDQYEQAIDDAAVDFADLAQEVMGNDITDLIS